MVAAIASHSASADVKVGEKNNGLSVCEERAIKLGHEADKKDVRIGRHIVDDGVGKYEPYNLPEGMVCDWADRIEAILRPPEPEPVEVSSSGNYVEPVYSKSTTYSAPAPSSGGCPASMFPESGTAGYSAYNPSSGAQGCYQVIPSTAEAHNCDLSTPAGQDACAAAICATQGNAAWSASGAAPC